MRKNISNRPMRIMSFNSYIQLIFGSLLCTWNVAMMSKFINRSWSRVPSGQYKKLKRKKMMSITQTQFPACIYRPFLSACVGFPRNLKKSEGDKGRKSSKMGESKERKGEQDTWPPTRLPGSMAITNGVTRSLCPLHLPLALLLLRHPTSMSFLFSFIYHFLLCPSLLPHMLPFLHHFLLHFLHLFLLLFLPHLLLFLLLLFLLLIFFFTSSSFNFFSFL